MTKRNFKQQATLCLVAVSFLASCVEKAPSRDEIPAIKSRISELVSFYQGERNQGLDSLLAPTFHAEMGERGRWQAITVEDQVWPLSGTARREFYYTQKQGEAELSFVYQSPDGQSDSLLPVKITLSKRKDLWLVEDVQLVEPLGL